MEQPLCKLLSVSKHSVANQVDVKSRLYSHLSICRRLQPVSEWSSSGDKRSLVPTDPARCLKGQMAGPHPLHQRVYPSASMGWKMSPG